jgi:hypothetical protein
LLEISPGHFLAQNDGSGGGKRGVVIPWLSQLKQTQSADNMKHVNSYL